MMRTKGPAFVILCLLMLLWAIPTMAQEQTGSIQGTVKDSSGAVLPGVTVTVTSPTVVGASTAVSDSTGAYRFPALPPGVYTVSAVLQGFTAQKSTATLSLGQLLTVPITMSVGGVSETVQVKGEAPLIDVKQNAAFATVSKEIIDRIPKGRDFTDVIAVAPGANAEAKSGGTQIDGASGSENRFIIDGMDTTNLQNGITGKTMLVDFIQEVQVKSSGYNAEFGGATGGVVSALTKSGSNQMHGGIGLYEQNNRFAGDQSKRGYHTYSSWNGTNGIANPIGCGSATTLAGQTCTGNPQLLVSYVTPWQYYSPVGDFGGPIKKDKLWYYFGMAYTDNIYNQTGVGFLYEPGHPLHNFHQSSWSYYPNVNITAQLNNNIRLRVSGSDQRNSTRGSTTGEWPVNQIMDADPTRYKPTTCNNLAMQDVFGKSLAGYSSGTASSFLSTFATGCAFDQTKFNSIYVNTGNDSRQDVLSGNLDWVIKPTFFINATGGYFRTNAWNPPQWAGNALRHVFSNGDTDTDMTNPQYPPITGTWPLVPAAFQESGGYSDQTLTSLLNAFNIYTRLFANANATLFKSWQGQHVIKAGLRFERFGENINNGYQKPTITFYPGRVYNTTAGANVAGKYGYYRVEQDHTVGQVYSNNFSFWLQDSWTVKSNLTINAGVRDENEHVPNYKTGVPVCGATITADCALEINFGFRQKIAPRLGFAYDIKGDSKWKAYGSFGWFYDITKLEMPRGSFGGEHWIYYYWTLDTYDWSTINCGEGSSGCPGTFIEQWDARRSSNQLDPDLTAYFNTPTTGVDTSIKPVKSGEFVLGMDHELNATMSIGLRYVKKWLTRTIEDCGILIPGIGEAYIIGNPGYGETTNMDPALTTDPLVGKTFLTPPAERDYDSLELRLRKRLANRWSAEIDYTYSKLWGNYGGLASSDENGRVSPNVNRYFDNLYMSYDDKQQAVFGLMPTDRPHVLKVQATYDFAWGTSVGAYAIIESGLPQSSFISFAGYPVYYTDRNDLGRLPIYKQIDLNVQHDIKLGGNRRVTLQANITNLFDTAGYTSLYTLNPYRDGMTPGVSTVGKTADEYYYGAPWTPADLRAALVAKGSQVRIADFYNVLDGRQGRRTIRFQAKFSF